VKRLEVEGRGDDKQATRFLVMICVRIWSHYRISKVYKWNLGLILWVSIE